MGHEPRAYARLRQALLLAEQDEGQMAAAAAAKQAKAADNKCALPAAVHRPLISLSVRCVVFSGRERCGRAAAGACGVRA
jgi:hypothetical protein